MLLENRLQSIHSILFLSKHIYIVPTPHTHTPLQDSESLVFYYWALFDGHAGSGAAVAASKLLQHHIVEHLQSVLEVLRNHAVLPPTIFGEESNHHMTPGIHRATLIRAASLRGAAGAPSSPCTPPPQRFFTEKKIQHDSLVMGAMENAFKEMVSTCHCCCCCVVCISMRPYCLRENIRVAEMLPLSWLDVPCRYFSTQTSPFHLSPDPSSHHHLHPF
jgi:hypothetical protein